MKLNSILLVDGYKVGHKFQYAPDTTFVFSNFTARSDRLAKGLTEYINGEILWAGLQGAVRELHEMFQTSFFNQPKEKVVAEYKRQMDNYLGVGAVATDHIEALHDLRYLPVEIAALPEGSLVPVRVPVFTINNTRHEFAWVTNMLETVLSSMVWQSTTNATVAFQYRMLIEDYAMKTGAPLDFVLWQGHDFSFRGMAGPEAATRSGAMHLLSFLGTDTVPAITYLEDYYEGYKTYVGGSVPASEHSVSSTNILALQEQFKDTEDPLLEAEKAFFKRYITEIYPSGVASYVADTYDFWGVLTKVAPACKSEIMARTPNALGLNKVVFRPDSGDPVDILCGNPNAETEHERKGAVEVLWDTFGGTITDKGFKVLDQHVGLIYGDSINLERCKMILEKLTAKGFASCNVVFGVGSYTYQYNTRDTYGFAIKSTATVVGDKFIKVFKDPKTDSGVKKSAKGLLVVVESENGYELIDDLDVDAYNKLSAKNKLYVMYHNGVFYKDVDNSLVGIRNRINDQVKARLTK